MRVVGTRSNLSRVDRYIEWGRKNFPDLLIAGLTLGTALELALTTVPYNNAVIPVALVSGPLLFLRHRFPFGAPTATFAALALYATISNPAVLPLDN